MSNICERCGGQKTVYYDVVIMPGKTSIAQYNPGIMKLCTCPIERTKHDGILGGTPGRQTRVRLDTDVPFDDREVHLENDWDDGISLTAREALSQSFSRWTSRSSNGTSV